MNGLLRDLLTPESRFGAFALRARSRLGLLRWQPSSASERAEHAAIAEIAPSHTMIGVERLRTLISCAYEIADREIEGCVVETGTWRGGSLALMDWALRRRGQKRNLIAFDSFEGLPPPGENDPDSAMKAYAPGWCAGTREDVIRAQRVLGSDAASGYRGVEPPEEGARLRLVKGWLEDTLPTAELEPIALLHVDVDWYDSVYCALEHLWDHVVPGGIVIFDDYTRWEGCDRAVADFFSKRGVDPSILHLSGRHGAWLRKPPAKSA